MDFLAHARLRAFSFWLRTGRLPRWARDAVPERKYNPWHDPDDGRFTLAGTGRYFGRGTSVDGVRMHESVSEPKDNLAQNGGGASGSYPIPRPVRDKVDDRPTDTLRTPLARIAANNAKGWRRTMVNQYDWWLDADGKLMEVEGTFRLTGGRRRSRGNQRRAGRPDRRPTDEGGHYIPPRLNGPTNAFNHFPQDFNFNRSRYLRLENQWVNAVRDGKRVDFRIVPIYKGRSLRPDYVNVIFWIDGKRHSLKLANESEVSRDRR